MTDANQLMQQMAESYERQQRRRAEDETPWDITEIRREVYLKDCRAAYEELIKPIDYEVGDWVVWKEGLSNRGCPDYGQPVICTDLMEPDLSRVTADEDSGSCMYREPLTMKMGIPRSTDNGQTLVEFHADARRFKKWIDTGPKRPAGFSEEAVSDAAHEG
jgi:hypothetical protein